LLEAWPLLLLDGYAVAISRIGKEGWYPCDSDSSALSIENHELQLDKEVLIAVWITPNETADLRDDLVVWAVLLSNRYTKAWTEDETNGIPLRTTLFRRTGWSCA
jgi:hypothetical protein